MKRLSCLESMKCRNDILNARFIFRLINPPHENTPASELFTHQLAIKKGFAFEWKKDNKSVNYILDIKNDSVKEREKCLKKRIKEIRFGNISQENLGFTRISDAINVVKTLDHSEILKWNGLEDTEYVLKNKSR